MTEPTDIQVSLELIPETQLVWIDGDFESFEPDVTPEEKFFMMAGQLTDWKLKNRDQESVMFQKERDMMWKNARDSIDNHIGNAMMEMEVLSKMMEKMIEGKTYNLLEGVSPPPLPISNLNDRIIRIMSKKMELEKARDKLRNSFMKLNNKRENRISYFESILRLRKKWRVAISQNLTYSIDCSLAHDGSHLRIPQYLHIDIKNGEPSISVPNNILSKDLIINSISPGWEIYPIELSDQLSTDFSGERKCNLALERFQKFLFNTEILQHFEVPQNPVHQVLKDQVNINVGDDYSLNIKIQNAIKSDFQDPESEEERVIFSILRIHLRKTLREIHRKNRESRMDEKGNVKSNLRLLDEGCACYKHLRLCVEISKYLDLLTSNIPFMKFRTLSTFQKLVSSYRVAYNERLKLVITLNGTVISIGQDEMNEIDFKSYLLYKLIDFTWSCVVNTAKMISEQVEKLGNYSISAVHKFERELFFISLRPEEDSFSISVRKKNLMTEVQTELDWSECLGHDLNAKIALILTQ